MIRPLYVLIVCGLLASPGAVLAAPPANAAPASRAAAPAVDSGVAIPAAATSAAMPAAAASSGAAADVPSVGEIRTFTRAFELIKQAYVARVGNKQLMQSAVRGMLAGLDPHSAFLDKSQLEKLTNDTSGAYAGLGVEVAQVNHQLMIITPLDGSPAQRAGILPGDVIEAINGKPVRPDAISAAIKRLGGPIGSTVKLTIQHPKVAKPVTITLTRQRIHVASVKTRMLKPGFAYVRITEFEENTADELTRALQKLQKKHGPLKGVVLDLRSNPGGLVTSAVGVADDFLSSGVIVTTRGRLPQSDLKFMATPGDLLHGAPMVVLVNNGTASAAEIVTGALKDHHRALVMGRRTFGKGSVQSILPLGNGDALKLTTARYYTPNGTSIQAAGITPNIVLGNVTVSLDRAPSLADGEHESSLPHHLAGTHKAAREGDAGDLAAHDYALSVAVHVLEGLSLARHPSARTARTRSSAH
jgi:carboxyl-terminal processing protease